MFYFQKKDCYLNHEFSLKTLDNNPPEIYDYCLLFLFLLGLIAQWIEHPPSKRVVVGSNPTQSVFKLLF